MAMAFGTAGPVGEGRSRARAGGWTTRLLGALDRRRDERVLRACRRHPEARALLARRPDLGAALSAPDALGLLPRGSLGRAAGQLLRRAPGGCHARGAPARSGPVAPTDSDRAFVRARLAPLHVLSHVLTGYGCDPAGELATLAFELGQTGDPAAPGLLLATLRAAPSGARGRWLRFVAQAWRRGRSAAPLHAVALEDLLPRSLEAVRESLGIPSARIAHPEGIVEGGGSLSRSRDV